MRYTPKTVYGTQDLCLIPRLGYGARTRCALLEYTRRKQRILAPRASYAKHDLLQSNMLWLVHHRNAI
jgi:hypothetical protein